MTEERKELSFPVRSDVNALAKGILEVMDITEKYGVNPWLCYGALLGMIRDNQLLPWNNDAELGCWYDPEINSKFKFITNDLISKGYIVYYYSSIGSITARKKGVHICINCFWRDGEFALRPHEAPSEIGKAPYHISAFCWLALLLAAYTGRPTMALLKNSPAKQITKILTVKLMRLIPKFLRKYLMLCSYSIAQSIGGVFQTTAINSYYFNKFKYVKFYGSKVLIPDDSEGLLAYIYGDEWKIPKDSWSYYSDVNKNDTGIKFIDKVWDYRSLKII